MVTHPRIEAKAAPTELRIHCTATPLGERVLE
jgi:hypothetical protein